jgi:two-component system chemotaxis response regulator CheY
MFESPTRSASSAGAAPLLTADANSRPEPVTDLLPNRVLVVEDSAPVLQLVTMLLGRCGIDHVMSARCGSEAVDVLRGTMQRTDCVISDVMMPAGSGLQLLQAIRSGELRGVRPDMCVVLISACWTPELLKRARELDVSGVLAKPFTLDKIKAELIAARKRIFPLDIQRYRTVALPIQWYLPR